ncbi:hypothetical protein HRH59_09460 [Rheinheimera sp. YQF-2]|uniref:Uncharacterized protein n=1 Tax=Rheinheimera lutimaris TaxID=2740584 RepID=A0A7Y5AQN4_9GAMM|nr:hypothetical protein [Rheinheimera lutimaris]NRQ42776.1 hypothetical protein [Rheinheimera lutimaris]
MNWSEIDAVLFSLDKIIFIAYFVLLILVMLFQRKVSSFVITLVVLSVANGAMTSLSPMLYQFSSQPGMAYKFTWYASFALIDMLAVFLLYKFHYLLKQSVSFVANLTGMFFVMLATLQTFRFIDRFIFDAEVFQQIYRYGIPSLNIVQVSVVVISLIYEFKLSQRYLKAGSMV